MSWYDAIIPPIKRRKKNRATPVPEGVWTKCQDCNVAIYERSLIDNLRVCNKCGYHHHLTPALRAGSLFDDGVYEEIGTTIRPRDFLKFTDNRAYKERLATNSSEDPAKEGIRIYFSKIASRPAVAACFDWSFMGGSMGSVVGERFVRGIDVACDRGAAFIVFTSSGGARMQEGLTSLMQMAKTTAAQAKLHNHGLPFISVLCNPTTGGVAASFALVGDVIIAEPGATIGFAGERVIRSTVREELPPEFQRSEFLLKHGSIDMVVDRRNQRNTIAAILTMLLDGRNKREEQ